MGSYRLVGDHAEILEGGRPIEPGEFVDLTDKEVTGINKDLVEAGKLMSVEEMSKQAKATKTKGDES